MSSAPVKPFTGPDDAQGLTDEEIAREIDAVATWSDERLAAVHRLGSEIAAIAAAPDAEEQIDRLTAAGRPLRDWIIFIARSEIQHELNRRRSGDTLTRTSPIAPCEEYDPSDFWKAFDLFKSAVAEIEACTGSSAGAARAAAMVAFRGGPLPTGLPEREQALVEAADAALFHVRVVLSVPGAWGRTPGGKKSLETDLWNLESALCEFESRASGRNQGTT